MSSAATHISGKGFGLAEKPSRTSRHPVEIFDSFRTEDLAARGPPGPGPCEGRIETARDQFSGTTRLFRYAPAIRPRALPSLRSREPLAANTKPAGVLCVM